MAIASTSRHTWPSATAALPAATYDILQRLSTTGLHAAGAAQPVPSAVRPDLAPDDDDPAVRVQRAERINFVRTVLGGWLTSLASQQAKDGTLGAPAELPRVSRFPLTAS